MDQDDVVSFNAQLFDADGLPVSPPAGTTILWQLAPFPYNTASGISASFAMHTLPLSLLVDEPYLRIHAFWLDFSSKEILGFDSKSLHLDVSAAPLAKTASQAMSEQQRPMDCTQWFDLLGRPIAEPRPGQWAINACGQRIWQTDRRAGQHQDRPQGPRSGPRSGLR